MPETLYNGIELPDSWPPSNLDPRDRSPMPVPYLENRPEVAPIDAGRQLLVDDFLVEKTDLERIFHLARKHEANPVLAPETPMEKERVGDRPVFPAAVPKGGGVWWDPAESVFKMWYEAGWLGTMAYATSCDGLNWERPELDVEPPTNRIVPGLIPDSTTVFLDHDAADPRQRFKLFLRSPNVVAGGGNVNGFSLVSADGIHWSEPVKTGDCGDRSTVFYNPFRKRWVYSIRSGMAGRGRSRHYREHPDFLEGASWTKDDTVFWAGADELDAPDPAIGMTPQLYNLDAVAYESVLLGLFEIHLGPENDVCEREGHPKTTELMTAFSRDGFHWHRPDRRAFIPASRTPEAWDRGYVQSVGGLCLVMGDELWFPYTGFRGDPPARKDICGMDSAMYGNGSTGYAVLRRDGFASLRAAGEAGTLLTRPVTFGGEHLFVNADASRGELVVEICSPEGDPLPGFGRADCEPVSVDATCAPVRWRHGDSLRGLRDRPVRLRFLLSRGDLYAFWISRGRDGTSGGYPAAGGASAGGGKA